jgi:hypothetical protein
MRRTGNFNPEWGFVAPLPAFRRTLRVTVIAALIGASAGAATVIAFTVRPAAEDNSVAARTLVAGMDRAHGAQATGVQQPRSIPAAGKPALAALAPSPPVQGREGAGAENPPAQPAIASLGAQSSGVPGALDPSESPTQGDGAAKASVSKSAAADAAAGERKYKRRHYAARKRRAGRSQEAYDYRGAPFAIMPPYPSRSRSPYWAHSRREFVWSNSDWGDY